ADHESGVEHATERDQVGQHVRPDPVEEHVALPPAEGHARGHAEPERGVASRVALGEEEDVLQDPAAIGDGDPARGGLAAVEELVVIAMAGADEVEPEPSLGTEVERGRLLLRLDELDARGGLAPRAAVRLPHPEEAGPARTTARERDAMVTEE